MSLRLLAEMPDSIPPEECEAVIFSVLTAPACSADTRGLTVVYRRDNNWRLEIPKDVFGEPEGKGG